MNTKKTNLERAVKELIEAEKNMPDGFCSLCALTEFRGNGNYCWDHEEAGNRLQDARQAVIIMAKKHF